VDERITRLGCGASSLRRGGLTTFLRGMRSQGASPLDAPLIQDSIADIAAEHYEIATYTTLITAARACRDEETARVCREILREEEEMARWLEEHLTVLVRELVHPKETPEAEKTAEEKQTSPVDAAGTLRREHVFAVFDAEDQAQQAEQALSAMSIQPQGARRPHHHVPQRGRRATHAGLTRPWTMLIKEQGGKTFAVVFDKGEEDLTRSRATRSVAD
jgi:Domain of unknown function (DUF892)